MEKKNYHFKIVKKAFKKHKDWIKVLKSFGCKEDVAEDICQEMYIQLQLQTEKGLDIAFDDDINYYYIYKMLKGMYLNLHKKESRIKKIDIGQINQSLIKEELGIDEQEYINKIKGLNEELEKIYWYDKKVFVLIASGISVSKLSRETNISYYSLYNTYKNVKKHLKEKLCD